MSVTSCIILIAIGYLLGSINSAIVVSKVFMGYDIRSKGSGNAGLTNSYRCMGVKPTVFVLLGDIAKAAVASVVGGMLCGPLGTLICGSGAIIGHMFPLYFGFKGGKGILVGGTMIAVFDWRIFCIIMLFFFVLVGMTKWVSLGSIVATVLVPFLTIYFYWDDATMPVMAALLFVMAAAVVYMHRANIVRIIHGEENQFSLHRDKK
ncbi:MAG: glycerol-3-phosphate 1-O-acyltransferase PlsY [Eubacteriales bacterium]|nr:glycerol-3-phosphate 1-O-acyltransferase PlsY [Eubacteriales bacterium]